jgi:hypothetical protein
MELLKMSSRQSLSDKFTNECWFVERRQ